MYEAKQQFYLLSCKQYRKNSKKSKRFLPMKSGRKLIKSWVNYSVTWNKCSSCWKLHAAGKFSHFPFIEALSLSSIHRCPKDTWNDRRPWRFLWQLQACLCPRPAAPFVDFGWASGNKRSAAHKMRPPSVLLLNRFHAKGDKSTKSKRKWKP